MKKNSQQPKRYQVHYAFINISSPLRENTEVAFKSLHENKKICEQLGGENCEQYESVPELIDETYMIHPECYKKFIYAQKILKRKRNNEN